MKKNYLFFLILLLVVTVSVPYGASFLLKSQYYEIINNFNHSISETNVGSANNCIKISGEFNVGWLTSKAKTSLYRKNSNNDGSAVFLELEHTIQNGPIIINLHKRSIQAYKLALVNTKLKGEGVDNFIKYFYQNSNSIEINTEIAYNGNGCTNFNSLPFTKNIPNGQIKWHGAELLILHNKDFSGFNYDMHIPRFIYQEGKHLLDLQKITSAGTQQLTDVGLWHGNVNWQFKQFDIKTNNKTKAEYDVDSKDLADIKSEVDKVFSISNFKFATIITIQDALVKIAVNMHIDQIFELASNKTTGPLTLAININNIDGKKLRALQKPNYKNIKNLGKAINDTIKIAISKPLAYEIAAAKIEHDILLEARDFELLHEGQKMPKPYRLTSTGRLEEIEKRVIEEIAKLVQEKFLLEKDETFVATINVQNGDVIINGNLLP